MPKKKRKKQKVYIDNHVSPRKLVIFSWNWPPVRSGGTEIVFYLCVCENSPVVQLCGEEVFQVQVSPPL